MSIAKRHPTWWLRYATAAAAVVWMLGIAVDKRKETLMRNSISRTCEVQGVKR